MKATSITVPTSMAVHVRHLADEIHGLGATALGYLFLDIVSRSSAALDCIERHAGLTAYAELIAAFAVLPPKAWRVK